MIPTPVSFKGAPGSPYTRKMMAYLRYRHIPYRFLVGEQAEAMGMPSPKVGLLPTFYLPDETGELQAVVDSTPLIRRFESEVEGRAVIPADPVVRFVDYLLEDFGDEWLTKAMFHYRWYYDADIEKAGNILPLWRDISQSPELHGKTSKFIAERQISRLYVVGSNDTTAPVIEASYHRFLELMDSLLQQHPFVMGDRPGAADFAFYAQLTQLAGFDPTPQGLCLQKAPRVYAWVDIMDDLSGAPVDENTNWLSRDELAVNLGELLAEVGRVYTPVLLANADALMAGQESFETTVDGQSWTQPAFPYQAKCLQWIREQFEALADEDRSAVTNLLSGTGCEPILSKTA